MKKILHIMLTVLFISIMCFTSVFSQTGKWTQMFPATSPPARDEHAMAYLGDDKILMFGGGQTQVAEFGDTWIYDLSDNEWTEVKSDSSPSPRDSPAMANIGDGRVLLFGGLSLTGETDDTWLFNLETMQWTELYPNRKPYKRYRTSSANLGENKVLLYSGDFCPIEYSKYQDGWCHDTWIFDLQKNEWDSITNDYPRGRELAQMCELNENQIILYGGAYGGSASNDNYLYDKILDKWSLYNPIIANLKRGSSTMINLKENLTFVFGGILRGNTDTTVNGKYGDDSWLFDFADSTWIQIFPEIKPPGRYNHKMAKISEGKGILFGGLVSKANADETWLFEYDPTGVKDSTNVQLARVKIINKSNNCEVNINNLTSGKLGIELYDINGILINQIYDGYNLHTDFKFEFNTENINSGSYFMIIKTKNINYYKQILVVH